MEYKKFIQKFISFVRKHNKAIKITSIILLILFLSGFVVILFGYQYFKAQVPEIKTIAEYRPMAGTKVYSYDGQLIAEFFKDNRRNIVPYDKIPKTLRLAFVAGEDADFYDHHGIRPFAMLRAGIRWLTTGVKQGGSTISQQLAKAFLSSERTFSRKFKDIVLAIELEKHLSKEEILYLYLNEIYLGSGAYGVESASRAYFDKHVWELTIAEMATLAGLPKFPTRANPIIHPQTALRRRNYVLERLYDEEFITEEEYENAKNEPIVTKPQKSLFLDKAPYFSERVRRHLLDTYGYDKLYNEGLTVYTTVDMRATKLAHEAMFLGLRSLGKRQGYTGAVLNINLKEDLTKYLKRHRKVFGVITEKDIIRGKYYQGIVLKTQRKKAIVQVGEVKRHILLEDLQWAHPYKSDKKRYISSTSQVLSPGDIIMVHATDKPGTKDVYNHRRYNIPLPEDFYFVLEQTPPSQGAIIVKDPYSGYIKALMGGFDFETSEFDRTTQACRQPGSAIKPVFYAQALEMREDDDKSNDDDDEKPVYTPATMLLDAPVTVIDTNFKPSNYERTFKGEVTFWEALVHSMNAPSVRLLRDIGLGTAIKGAKKLGIKSKIKYEYGSVLGSSCLTIDELTDAFAHFPNKGRSPHTTYIRKVYDRDGNVLEDNTVYYDPFLSGIEKINRLMHFSTRKEEQNLTPETAFIMTRILEDVIKHGTGIRAASIRRHIGGKTGTTNDYFDAWFIGFSPEVVTGVWVGNDKHGEPLGRNETGSSAALPIWKDFMARYLWEFPKTDFEMPENIHEVKIDRKTGLVNEKTGIPMYFIEGTEPQKTIEEESVIDPSKLQAGIL